MTDSKLMVRHVLLPGLAPLAIVALWLTPITIIGCANRGIAAFAIAVIAALAGIATAVTAIVKRTKSDPTSNWWVLSTIILVLPAALLLGPLG